MTTFPKPKKIAVLLLLLAALSCTSFAQGFYVTTGSWLMKVNPGTAGCTSSVTAGCIDNALSIALYHDTAYFNKGNVLYRAIRRSSRFEDCTFIAGVPGGMNALTVDSTGMLYFAAGNNLYKKDPHDNSSGMLLGTMPYFSAGDMVFFNGKLYLASTAGVVEVDAAAPDQSVLVIPSISAMYGLATLATDCDQNGLFGFINRGREADLVELDVANRQIARTICTLPFGVNDAASLVEDGSHVGMQIQDIAIHPLCDDPGKASIQVVCEAILVPYTFSLSNGLQNSTGLFQKLDPGVYTVTVTTPGGCRIDTTITIPSLSWQPATYTALSEDPSCSRPGKVWFSAQPAVNRYQVVYNRDTFSLAHAFDNLSFGDHRFQILKPFGCGLDSVTIHFLQKENCDTIYFPTAFTPNGDGRNDAFRGSYNYGLRDFRLEVFNRWGQRVFASEDQARGWDGFFLGRAQPTATYAWIARFTTLQGGRKTQKGTVTLIR